MAGLIRSLKNKIHQVVGLFGSSVYHRFNPSTAIRYRLGSLPVVLLITHSLGGGTEKHVGELSEALISRGAKVLVMRPYDRLNRMFVTLESAVSSDKMKVRLPSGNLPLLAETLQRFGISKIHIHHTLGFDFSVTGLVRLINVPCDLTIHDYFSVCPRFNMFRPGKGFCGTPSVEECITCLGTEPKITDVDIVRWRKGFESLFNQAANVYCPSQDCASRISAFFPAAHLTVVPHEQLSLPSAVVKSSLNKKRRFAILGVLNDHKGYQLVKEMLLEIDRKKIAVEFILIGYPDKPLKSKSLEQTGPYKDRDLMKLIEKFNPDAILFPVRWPETYCFTLSTAMLTGRTVIVPDLGALPGRVKGFPNGFIFPSAISSTDLIDYLVKLPLGERLYFKVPTGFKSKSVDEKQLHEKFIAKAGRKLNEFYYSENCYPLTDEGKI